MYEQAQHKLQIKKSAQIQIRLKNNLASKRKVKTWNQQEDQRLFHLYKMFPKKWNKIAEMMGNRNQNQCLHRFRRLNQQGQRKKIWSPQEDKVVLTMVQKYGHNWKIIASALKSKTGKQIRQRFLNKLDPQIKRQEWTLAEDIQIIQLYTKFGSKWSQISKYLTGRPQNRIKNRFYSHIQKNYDIMVKQQKKNIGQIIFEQNNLQNLQNIIPSQGKIGSSKYISSSPFGTIIRSGSKQNKQNEYRKQKDFFQKIDRNQDKSDKYGSKKFIEQEWKQRSLKQINQPNDMLGYRAYNRNQDFFYFQEN